MCFTALVDVQRGSSNSDFRVKVILSTHPNNVKAQGKEAVCIIVIK